MANDKAVFLVTRGRLEDGTPRAYRLARKTIRDDPSRTIRGEIILQGAYFWQDGNNYVHEWREIPIVELEE